MLFSWEAHASHPFSNLRHERQGIVRYMYPSSQTELHVLISVLQHQLESQSLNVSAIPPRMVSRSTSRSIVSLLLFDVQSCIKKLGQAFPQPTCSGGVNTNLTQPSRGLVEVLS